jgi:lincosamide nucleotidyltransferase A/C/D/E
MTLVGRSQLSEWAHSTLFDMRAAERAADTSPRMVRRVDITDVLQVLQRLDERGVRYWVLGGWGVDALVGQQTRDHRDLDLAVDAEQFHEGMREVEALGYRVKTDWLPIRVELVSLQGWVDLHPVRFDSAGHGVQAGPDGMTFDYPADALHSGMLGGRQVPCISVEHQISVHMGYEPRPQDLADLELLRRLLP